MTGLSHRWLASLGAVCLALVAMSSGGMSLVRADEPAATLPSVAERFAKADVTEEPDFRRHLVPLLGKQGCNGRACHGSFQGQGGFRLSLFGYDFELDHEQLMAGEKPRVLKDDPENSPAVLKPLLDMPHKGGRRMEAGSWEYRVWIGWIQAGAKNVPDDDARKVVLEVTPSEIQFAKDGDTAQLKVLARWSDGIVEDVTPLCRYTTNDETIAPISPTGLVTAGVAGDTHVVIAYDNAVVPIPVLRPVSQFSGDKYPEVPAPTKIDELVVQKWKKLGLVPSPVADDAEFLRRVSLDLTGTLPTANEVEAFLADSTGDKRAKKIDELLARPAYSAWWATKLCDITGNNQNQLNNLGGLDQNRVSQDWYDWMRVRLERNEGYDKIVEGIVLATTRREGESIADLSKRMTTHYAPGSTTPFSDEPGLDWYWARRNFRQPDDRALGFAYTFLGIRIQCAQCHKHPFDQWTQKDFKEFTGFFKGVSYGVRPTDRKEYEQLFTDLGIDRKKGNGNDLRRELQKVLKEGKQIPFEEVYTVQAKAAPKRDNKKNDKEKKNPAPAPVATAKTLGGEMLDLTQYKDAREPLMAWLRDPANPYFARAMVNRVWANYFNVGIVHPADDLSLGNPPSNKALLDHLTAGFVEHKFDLKWLHREIVTSRVYQLSWKPNDTNLHDRKNFSRAIPRRLPAEVAYDAIVLSTASDEEALKLRDDVTRRAIGQPGTANSRNANAAKNGPISNYVLTVFGKSIRESNCECDRSNEASLLQKVWIANDGEMLGMIDRKDGFVQTTLRGPAEAAKVVEQAKVKKAKAGAGPRKGKGDELNYDNLISLLEKRIARLKKEKTPDAAKIETAEGKLVDLKARRDKARDEEAEAAKKVVAQAEQEIQQAQAKTAIDLDAAIRKAYLRTLSRYPTDAEIAAAKKFHTEAANPQEGLKGLVWALLNTKEFIVNH
jgi:hypothetical protein